MTLGDTNNIQLIFFRKNFNDMFGSQKVVGKEKKKGLGGGGLVRKMIFLYIYLILL